MTTAAQKSECDIADSLLLDPRRLCSHREYRSILSVSRLSWVTVHSGGAWVGARGSVLRASLVPGRVLTGFLRLVRVLGGFVPEIVF